MTDLTRPLSLSLSLVFLPSGLVIEITSINRLISAQGERETIQNDEGANYIELVAWCDDVPEPGRIRFRMQSNTATGSGRAGTAFRKKP